MSHQHKILQHLRRKPITPIQALNLYGCFRLAARILDLRDEGHDIRTELVRKGGTHYAKYTLVVKS